MMSERRLAQEALFYEYSLERYVPADHLLRAIDSVVNLSGLRSHLRPFYGETGRPSINPELMIRMLIVGYCFGIRSERRLCDEIHLNLADRWFCRRRACSPIAGLPSNEACKRFHAVDHGVEARVRTVSRAQVRELATAAASSAAGGAMRPSSRR